MSKALLQKYLAGAIAEAAVEDLRLNGFAYAGFPEIRVLEKTGGSFEVTLSWKPCQAVFQLTGIEAAIAAKKFRSGTVCDRAVFDKVQSALAILDGGIANVHSEVPQPDETN